MGILESWETWGAPLAAASLALNALLAAFIIALWRKVRKAERTFARMLGESGVPDLQEVLIGLQDKVKTLQDAARQSDEAIASIRERLREIKGNVAICRYNAFEGHGSDLSFSVAIVDDRMNGVVITGLHGRDESYIYGKPLENGESSYSLSPEERRAISLALGRPPQHGAAAVSDAGRMR